MGAPSRALALSALLLLPGCGASVLGDAPPSEVLTATHGAVAQAGSARVVGSLVDDGAAVDLRLEATAGRGGRGSVVTRGTVVDFVADGEELFVRGDPEYWRAAAGPAAAEAFGDRWVAVGPSREEHFETLRRFADVQQVVGDALPADDGLRNEGTAVVDGHDVVVLRSGADDEREVYVRSDADAPVPLRVRGARGVGDLRFEEWGAPVDTAPPAGAQPLEVLWARAQEDVERTATGELTVPAPGVVPDGPPAGGEESGGGAPPGPGPGPGPADGGEEPAAGAPVEPGPPGTGDDRGGGPGAGGGPGGDGGADGGSVPGGAGTGGSRPTGEGTDADGGGGAGTGGPGDVGGPDVGGPDVGRPDRGGPDVGGPDVGGPDVGGPDGGGPDGGGPDGGGPDGGGPGVGGPGVGGPGVGGPGVGGPDAPPEDPAPGPPPGSGGG